MSKNGEWLTFLPTFLVHFLLMVLVVYVNVVLLIPKLFVKKKYVLYFTAGVLLIFVHTFLRGAYHKYIYIVLWDEKPQGIIVDFWMSFVYGCWFMVVSGMLYITQKWFDQQQQVKNIQINQLETELKYLRAQVNPHFLFNGLNTIYGNIDIQNQQARDILVQFSDLLRYNLYEADVDWIDLGKEAQYLENYVALQRARSNSNIEIKLDIRIEDRTIRVAPLIFIVFVENAIKFSTRDDNRINTIDIHLHQSGNRILFECSNMFENDEQVSGGIGLTNVTRRLELLYKDRYTLTVNQEGNRYFVQLILTV
jgi:hypothetical protein